MPLSQLQSTTIVEVVLPGTNQLSGTAAHVQAVDAVLQGVQGQLSETPLLRAL